MSAASLPYEREQRLLLGEFYKRANGDPTQELLDSFRAEHPDFEYSGLALLINKRRQLLSLGVLSPANDADREHIARYKEDKKKHRIKISHPAEQKYNTRRNCRRVMREAVHY